uniref:Zgc:136858 n=1 Tax=Callorhinchus milii TaxID=7868 RepID=A0A4W3JZI2_CALMI
PSTLFLCTDSICGLLRVHPRVSEAIANQKPVVVLESTIITHGMPYPHNLNTAREVEEVVMRHGAVPATVAVLKGRIHVGLSDPELQYLAESKETFKASRRDLPYFLSKGFSGGTTVSATMMVAHKVGIRVFVTGGIGGVHRDGQRTLDISADLTELGRTPVAVVSAGVKSILDIGCTLEYLETQGVCVATFGKTRDFPAFFIPQSGFQAPYNVITEEDAAQLIGSACELGQGSGVLIAVPIPEEHAPEGFLIEEAVQQSVAEARAEGILGKEVTPFILQRVMELTQGASLSASILYILKYTCMFNNLSWNHSFSCSSIVDHILNIVGHLTFICTLIQYKIIFAKFTNPGSVYQSFGGVGRNLADCLSRLGIAPLFISAIGQDGHAEAFLHNCSHMDTSAVARLPSCNTATYCVVITGTGELCMGIGDMDIHQQITEQYTSQFEERLRSASLVCLDGNIPVSTLDYVCRVAKDHNVPVWYEPTDFNKASKPFVSDSWRALMYTSPNLGELRSMNEALGLPVPAELPSEMEDVIDVAMSMSRPLLKHLQCVLVSLGCQGVLLCGRGEAGTLSLQPRKDHQVCALHQPSISVDAEEIMNVSGAGDSLAAAVIAGLLSGQDTHTCLRMGLLAANYSLKSRDPISRSITMDSVNPQRVNERAWLAPTYHWVDETFIK